MEDARLLEEAGAPGGSVAWADYQTEGRGRKAERRWVAPSRGALLATFFWHESQFSCPQFAPSLLIALGVLSWLKQYSVPGRFCVKWPNDILYEPEALKLAGILTIVRWRGTSHSIHAGIGVNLSPPPAGTYRRNAGSLSELGIVETPETALQQLMNALAVVFQDPNPRASLEPYLWHLGETAEWETPDGHKVSGRVQGLTEEGHLVLQTVSGTLTLTSGE